MSRRVVLATRALSGVMGGLERQITEIANALCNSDFEVHLIFISTDERAIFFELDQRVVIHKLADRDPSERANTKQRLARQFQVFRLLKEIKPEIAISFMTGAFFFTCLPTILLRIPRVLAERNSPRMYELTSAAKYKKWILFSMLFATRITTQFEDYKVMYPPFVRRKMIAIPNALPLELENRALTANQNDEEVNFLFAGRFTFQKRVDLLVDAFAQFAVNKQNVTLDLFGQGEYLHLIQQKVEKLDLQSKVRIHEPKTNLTSLIVDYDVLCAPSIWEGFPNVLLESLYLGVPGMGFSDCDGVRHLITDGENGWLAEFASDGSTLVKLFERAYHDVSKGRVSHELCRSSVANFVPSKVYGNWLTLINEIRKS
jgi:glycosyltransferase involved in cell wall biosynthesis